MDEAELRDDDLHDKRMARLKREREEKEAMKAEIVRTRAALVIAFNWMPTYSFDADRLKEARRVVTDVLGLPPDAACIIEQEPR